MKQNAILNDIKLQIIEYAHPEKIILFSYKQNVHEILTSFKLCVIVETGDKKQLERKLYKELECSIPFDIILYSKKEWETALKEDFSFAGTILEKGLVLYE